MTYLAIAFGGALGAVARYLFPYGIIGVNLLGAFSLACFNGWLVTRIIRDDVKLMITTGFMGAFTTFSTLSLINVEYLLQGQFVASFLYSLGSVGFGLMAAAIGFRVGLWLGRQPSEGSEAGD